MSVKATTTVSISPAPIRATRSFMLRWRSLRSDMGSPVGLGRSVSGGRSRVAPDAQPTRPRSSAAVSSQCSCIVRRRARACPARIGADERGVLPVRVRDVGLEHGDRQQHLVQGRLDRGHRLDRRVASRSARRSSGAAASRPAGGSAGRRAAATSSWACLSPARVGLVEVGAGGQVGGSGLDDPRGSRGRPASPGAGPRWSALRPRAAACAAGGSRRCRRRGRAWSRPVRPCAGRPWPRAASRARPGAGSASSRSGGSVEPSG